MYVCLCEGVSDRDIREAMRDGACSVAEVMRCTGAGTRCGSCRSSIAEVVATAAPGPTSVSRRHLELIVITPSAA